VAKTITIDISVLDGMEKSARKLKKGLDMADNASKQVKRALKELNRERIEILMEARDHLTPVVQKAQSSLKELTGKTWNVTLKATDYVTRPVRGILNLLASVRNMAFGLEGAFGAMAAPANIAGDYEQSESPKLSLTLGFDLENTESKSIKGFFGTVSDKFRNTLIEKWETGLWEGLKPGLEKVTGWLDDNEDKILGWLDRLQEMGAELGSFITRQIEGIQKAAEKLMEDPVWKSADFFGKIEIAWDRLIGEPFSQWWNSQGKEQITQAAGELGDFLGTGFNQGILAILGVVNNGAAEEGLSVGKSFVDGFLGGFEGQKISAALQEAISRVFESSFFGGGTSILSTALVGMAGLKGLEAGTAMGKGVMNIFSAIKSIWKLFQPSSGAAASSGAAQAAAAAGTASGAAAGTGISLSMMASIAGGVLGLMGLGSAVRDIHASRRTAIAENRDRRMKTGLAKGGLVAAGAGIGTLIAPGAGTFVGAGIGGLAALWGGDLLSDMFRSDKEKALDALTELGDDLEQAVENYNETVSKVDVAKELLGEYEELKKGLNDGEFDGTKAEEAQVRMKQILQDLQNMFPTMVSQYNILNGLSDDRIEKLGEELDHIEKKSERELKREERDLKVGLQEVEYNLLEIISDYQRKKERLDALQPEWEKSQDYISQMGDLISQYRYAPVGSEEERRLVKEANALYESFGYKPVDAINMQIFSDKLEEHIQRRDTIEKEMDELCDALDDADAQLKEYYDSSVWSKELDAGINLEEEQKKLKLFQSAYEILKLTGELDPGTAGMVEQVLPGFSEQDEKWEKMKMLADGIAEIQKNVHPVLEAIGQLTQELNILPEDIKININWDFTGPSLLETMPKMKMHYTSKRPEFGKEPGKRALGGFTSGPELSWIGEDGPEAVIPLSGKYRRRGLELYQKAGRYLGLGFHRDGTIYNEAESPAPVIFPGQADAGKENRTTQVQLSFNPQNIIQVNGTDSQEEMETKVRQSLSGMLDEMAADIARMVLRANGNIPGGEIA
jgi:conjugal transfer/entry exclusion protein